MGEMINSVAEGVALDFFVHRKRAVFGIITELHLRSIKTSFTFDKVADFGIFHDHSGPKWIAWKTEEESTVFGGDLDHNISPAGDNMFALQDFFIRDSFRDNFIKWIFGGKKCVHRIWLL